MHPHIAKLYESANKPHKLIIGLMSGTSLDGLDVALCKISNHGMNTNIELIAFDTIAYDDNYKQKIRTVLPNVNAI